MLADPGGHRSLYPGAAGARGESGSRHPAVLPRWQRIILLSVIGYEAAGCLAGGALLVAAPDGRYMDMPTGLMHGVFPDFFVPGLLLAAQGVLGTFAFLHVFRRTPSDWWMAGLSLGGLVIWFVVEIIILQELHWLHLMWGVPVLLGWIFLIPLIALRNDTPRMHRALLACGLFSSAWYAVINIVVPIFYEGYNAAALTVSELSAIGAPTRILWVLLVLLYPLLFASFGWGIVLTSGTQRKLKMTGQLIIVYSLVNLFWPPMHRREIIAAGGGTLTDTLHITWAMATLAFMLLMMGFAAGAAGARFRRYTFFTFGVFLVFGFLSGIESPHIEMGLPTPYLGLWERINIGAFMCWTGVLSALLLSRVTLSERKQENGAAAH
jgi:hypothetical protein